MSDLDHDMSEAARLTRTGRLSEATALLQRLLSGTAIPPAPASSARASDRSTVIDGVFERIEPAGRENRAAPPPRPTPAGWEMPEALRGFLDQLGMPGTVPGGADPAPEQGAFVTHAFASAAGSRDYRLFTPEGHEGRALPLVVMLHGCTQGPDDFATGTGMNRLAREHGCLVAYPAQPASANPTKCWNWFNPADQERDRGEPALIAGITRQIMARHQVDPARIYVAGLSAGGAAAAIMASAYPDLYAAVGVHSGLPCGAARDLPSAMAAMSQGGAGSPCRPLPRVVPTIVFHGDQDMTVNPRNADQLIAQQDEGLRRVTERGAVPGGRSWSRTRHLDSAGQPMLEQWLIHGAGHAWSGGNPRGSFTDPRGPDASAEMLRFFLDHPRRE